MSHLSERQKKAMRFRTWYRHRSGKIMVAAEYGYKAWPLFR